MERVYKRDSSFFFFFNDTAPTEIYTLSLHDALPISKGSPPAERGSTRHRPGADHLRRVIQRAEGGGSEAAREGLRKAAPPLPRPFPQAARFSPSPESRFASGALSPAHCQYAQRFPSQVQDRKSTRLNSSHSQISYAVFCLKKKKKK